MVDRKVWLITGAGRGLGLDIAKATLAAGHAVVATGRDPGKVTAVVGHHIDLLAIKLDVTRLEDAYDRAGLLLTLSSTAGITGQMFCTAYAAAKFGIEGWIESLTPEIAPFGIRTLLVEPGFFRTELLSTQSTTMRSLPSTTTPSVLGKPSLRGAV